ncbi:MAG: dolichyl-phosphate-mannose--protein mannosyltransferase [Tannerellaceae bacterium]|nr:dolichyl-phosphate-mannose--protein mannosyltransferase [Tannerellaceae bacterium]MCD8265435.1 dolichyl-phosphate-mannose--protein mannosyltransferase [Tannerellaceae bacterium]
MVIIICIISVLPWIGMSEGYSLEAAVATRMLESGKWFIPQLPTDGVSAHSPMLYWLIAAFSSFRGVVTPITAHLPAALGFSFLVGSVLVFFGRAIRFQEAFIATLLLITCTGIQQAAIIAPANILFSVFTILALILMYNWEDKDELQGLPIGIPLLLSCAILSKGISGLSMPLCVFGVYIWSLKKYSTIRLIKAMVYPAVSTLFLPMLWYIAIWHQGGSLLNYSLRYEYLLSDILFSLLKGFLPWTMLLLFSLFGINYHKTGEPFKNRLQIVSGKFHALEPIKKFSWITIFVMLTYFIAIPSGPNWHFLPLYPFLALFMAQYFIYIAEYRTICTRLFAACYAIVAFALLTLGGMTMSGSFELVPFISGLTGNEYILSLTERVNDKLVNYTSLVVIAMFFTIFTLVTVGYQLLKKINIKILYSTIALTFAFNLLCYILLQ